MSKNTKFAREFQRLNSEQRQAVETIEGPVMVIAGPGTGKTQVVAMRIAQILTKTQMGPRNILALTFTEAGVTALRRRLEALIGPDAYQVTIATFHGFASQVIGQFPYAFASTTTLTHLGELERLQILDQIVLSDHELDCLRPSRVPTFHVREISRSISTLKQEAVLPDQLAMLVEQQVKELKSTPLSPAARSRQERQTQILTELTEVYRRYQRYLFENGRYDYEDMILFVIEALNQHADVRAYYQERYQYILVDEYQDTNNSQNNLVQALASFFPNPNLFVVGDDKQAIFRFQGASVANMLHFLKRYPSIKVISLRQNYRSQVKIVEAATTLISHNQHQLNQYLPELVTHPVATDAQPITPLLVSATTPEAQFAWIIDYVKCLQQNGQRWSEMAVLFRTNHEAGVFRSIAEKYHLPVSGVVTTNVINEPEIQQLLQVFRAINDPLDNLAVMSALRTIDRNIPLSSFVKLGVERRKSGKPVAEIIATNSKQRLLDPQEDTQLLRAAETLQHLSQLAQERSLSELVEIILTDSSLLSTIEAREDNLERLELLRGFIEEIQRFTLRRREAGLTEMLSYLQSLSAYNIGIPINRITPEEDGLFISTVHSSKGLEFETVILANAGDDHWNGRAPRRVINLPSEIVGMNSDWDDDPIEDERRLFYVGMTRAKEQLVLSYAETTEEGASVLQSQFLSELFGQLEVRRAEISDVEARHLYLATLSPIPSEVLDLRQLNFIRSQVESMPLTIDAYQAYRRCPRQYLLREVLQFPSLPTISRYYGDLIHRSLEFFFRQYRRQKTLPNLDVLLNFYRQAMLEKVPISEQRALEKKGVNILTQYYQKMVDTWSAPIGVEYDFSAHRVMLDDIWLTGKVDRIDPIDPVAKTVRFIEYKSTSRPKSRNQILGKTKNDDGEIYQQLVYYALLARQDRQFPYHATEFVVAFVDDSAKFTEETFKITATETEALAAEIKKTHHEIVSRSDFPHTRDGQFDQGCEICALFPTL